jgi:transposase-like protein
MKKTHVNGTQKRDTSKECCLNEACPSRGLIGQGNIVIHDSSRGRLKCKICKITFNKRRGTALEGIRKPEELFVTVISLISWGCPIQAIVHTYNLDERTVADWQLRAGLHCEKVHQDQIEQGKLDPKQGQADEMRIKARGVVLWMAMAMVVPTRLWVAGAVSKTRDSHLIDRLMLQTRRCCKDLCSLLICTDGFAAYPKSILRAFREKNSRSWKMLPRSMAGFTDWNGDQAYSQETLKGGYPTSDLWDHRTDAKASGTIKRRINAQYFLYRAIECHIS